MLQSVTVPSEPSPPEGVLWGNEGLCGPQGSMDDREALSFQIFPLESWFDGNTDTQLNHRDTILAKCTDTINSYLLRNGLKGKVTS